MRVGELCAAGLDAFVGKVGGVYEHSPWIAEKAFSRGPFTTLSSLAEAMKGVLDEASEVRTVHTF